MEVTVEIARRAKLAGACSVPLVGTPIERLTFSQLCWAEDHSIVRDDEMVALCQPKSVTFGRLPLWAFCGYGYGDGSGSGSGAVDGYGAGDGYGYGDGYWDGDGSGYGYESGDGDGSGDGYGSGDGSGYGYGSYVDTAAASRAVL